MCIIEEIKDSNSSLPKLLSKGVKDLSINRRIDIYIDII